MAVNVEFTIRRTDFPLGQAFGGTVKQVTLERVVPLSSRMLPFFWVRSENLEEIEANLEKSEYVTDVTQIANLGYPALYHIEFANKPGTLLKGLMESDATLLEASGNGVWEFNVRFLSHEHASQFYEYCREYNLPINIEAVYTLSDEEWVSEFGLTAEQREALLLALREGYFDTPKRASQADLAETLDIAPASVSDRLRRGIRKVLQHSLLPAEEGPS